MKKGQLVYIKEPNDHWSADDKRAVLHGGHLWIVQGKAGENGPTRDVHVIGDLDLYWCTSLADNTMHHPWYTYEVLEIWPDPQSET